MSDPDALQISIQMEDLLVGKNLRGMQTVQPALRPGYLLRSARLLLSSGKRVLIATGFPVLDTFETDGPVGAIALTLTLQTMGYTPLLLCETALAQALQSHYPVVELPAAESSQTLVERLHTLQPDVLVSIERPGAASDGRYYNMRAEDISARIAPIDAFVTQQYCPCIGIGDGGNELGMGNIEEQLQQLQITPAVTCCSELILADVSNWGALGLIAMLGQLQQRDFLAAIDPLYILGFLSSRGSLDGVTRRNEMTEDGLPATEGIELLQQLRRIAGFS